MPRKRGPARHRGCGRRTGFNEAAAVMPRKSPIQWLPLPGSGRFNEAAAVMPRKRSPAVRMSCRDTKLQ